MSFHWIATVVKAELVNLMRLCIIVIISWGVLIRLFVLNVHNSLSDQLILKWFCKQCQFSVAYLIHFNSCGLCTNSLLGFYLPCVPVDKHKYIITYFCSVFAECMHMRTSRKMLRRIYWLLHYTGNWIFIHFRTVPILKCYND